MSPRPRLDQDVVLRATLELIAVHGVTGVTVDTVAAATGASKATIYRHWGSRAELIHRALERLQQPSTEPDTGSLRGDLDFLLRQLVRYLNHRDRGRIFASLVDAAARDPELRALHRQNERHGRAFFERAIRRGISRGEVPAGTDVRLMVDLLLSPFIYRRVVVQKPARTVDVAPIIDRVLTAFGCDSP